jgi:O-antigen/teichoic acid export membrane protein
MEKKVLQNAAANIVGRAWGVATVYFFVPLYLKFLGIDGYGLIGFFVTLQSIIALGDMGMTAAVTREMARVSALGNVHQLRADTMRSLEVVSWGISLIVSVAVWCAAPWIVSSWLSIKPEELSTVTQALRLVGIANALQLPAGLYSGALLGMELHVLANIVQICVTTLRTGGAVLALWLFSPQIITFAWVQIVVVVMYLIIGRGLTWKVIKNSTQNKCPPFSWGAIAKIKHYAAGMAVIAALSVALTQIDKLWVSRTFSLGELGTYSLAFTLAMIPLTLAGPIAAAVFPRLTSITTNGSPEALKKVYLNCSKTIALVTVPLSLTICGFSTEVIYCWTGSMGIAEVASVPSSILILGQLIQAITTTPYYIALAHGDVKINLIVGLVSLVLIATLLAILIPSYGLVGSAMAWLFMNLLTFGPYMWYIHKRFLPGYFTRWIWEGLFTSAIPAAVAVGFCKYLLPAFSDRLTAALNVIITCLSATVVALGVQGYTRLCRNQNSLTT